MSEPVSVTTFEKPDFFSAMMMVRRRRRKIENLKRAAADVNYLNIVAMMDMMTILLVFLLKSVSFTTISVSAADITLPYSTTQVEPVEAVKVFITRSEITVEDKKVAVVQNDAILPEYVGAEDRYLIKPLKAILDQKATELAAIQRRNPKATVEDNLTILADKDTPYQVLMQVLYTASRATASLGPDESLSFGKFRLTVLKRES
jgi:biopolymer transport protein ExbD